MCGSTSHGTHQRTPRDISGSQLKVSLSDSITVLHINNDAIFKTLIGVKSS